MTGEQLECKRNKVDKKITRHWLCAHTSMDLRATPEVPQYPKKLSYQGWEGKKQAPAVPQSHPLFLVITK
jgi:hypothetical protein